jgi:hypothetical protein
MPKHLKFTREQLTFIKQYLPGRFWKDVLAKFRWLFPKCRLRDSQIKQYTYKHLKMGNGIDAKGKKGMHFSTATEFKKGQKPIRPIPKGARISPATEFKKGNQPHNTVPVGTEIMKSDGYIWIKLREQGLPGRPWRKWEQKHRMIWEAANGPVPDKCKVTFINGDHNDCSIENLMLVTNSQHCYLNHTHIRGMDKDSLNIGLNLHKLNKVIYDNKQQSRKERSRT